MRDIEILLTTKEARRLDSTVIFDHRETLAAFWYQADSLARYICSQKFITRQATESVEYFILADYVTYIPFGSAGYNELQKILKSKDPNNSVEKYRFTRLLTILESTKIEIPEDTKALIENFFLEYNNKTKSFSNVMQFASMICRIFHEFESKLGEAGFENSIQISNEAENLLSKILEQDSADMEKLLREIEGQQLNEEKKAYLYKMFSLN